MRLLTLLITICVSMLAAAAEFSTQDAFQFIIENSGKVKLVDKASQNPSDKNLSSMLAEQILMADYLNAKTGDQVEIPQTTLNCDAVEEAADVIFYDCVLVLTSGDYVKSKDGLEGPQVESATILEFTISHSALESKYKILDNQMLVWVAG